MKREDTVWIVSAEPPGTEFAHGAGSAASLIFKDQVSAEQLNATIADFTRVVGVALDSAASISESFYVDQVEITAVMAVDGKLGILGSSVGGKTEGAVKFTFRRRKEGGAR